MNNIFSWRQTGWMCWGWGISSRIVVPSLSWLTCMSPSGSLPWCLGPWARCWSTPLCAYMVGFPCDTASPDTPPIAWGATFPAPDNFMHNRTVYLQFTLNWTGLAPVVSDMSVELLVDLPHHPLGAGAPAPASARRGGEGAAGAGTLSPGLGGRGVSMPPLSLGSSPHQIRG